MNVRHRFAGETGVARRRLATLRTALLSNANVERVLEVLAWPAQWKRIEGKGTRLARLRPLDAMEKADALGAL